jgi:uncharacterized protein
MRTRLKAAVAVAAVLALGLAACGDDGGGTAAEGEDGLPRQLVWSTYGTGTATYADLAAVANAITNNEGTQIRIITSDTAVGRMTPLVQGQADMARTGDEYIFSYEGDYDFASPDWGPQDVRVVWAPVAPHGLLVRADSGIETFEDLRGRNFPRITANPSVNNKLEAFLAYGGMTWDDVRVVELGYGEQPDALRTGSIDVLFHQVYGAALFELESAVPVRWLSMDDETPERVEAVNRITASVIIGPFSGAPGQPEGETAQGMLYTVPLMTYADREASVVEATVRAIDEHYEAYRDTTATTDQWNTENVLTMPTEVPYHEGTIAYLEEVGAWSDEAAERNEQLLERGENLRAAWQEFLETNPSGDLQAAWTEYKEQNVPTVEPPPATPAS